MGCSSSKEEKEDYGWICQIDEEYLYSSVSVYGLEDKVDNFSKALKIVRGKRGFLSSLSPSQQKKVIADSNKLFALLHARYLCTEDGADVMLEKYENGIFGECPRMLCHGEKLLPIGLTYEHGIEAVHTFCPRCHDIYETNEQIDGAYFGPDFPLYFMRVNKIGVQPYETKNWVESGNETIDRRLKRWPETHHYTGHEESE